MFGSTNPRQIALLRHIQAHGHANVESLAKTFAVTPQTIRRDVQRLSESGQLARYRGGARLPNSTIENIDHRQRESLHAAAKQVIAAAVESQLPDSCSLIINIGTTAEAIARALMRHKGLRVITNNLNVAAILALNEGCEVIVAGGVVRSRDGGIVGEPTISFIRQFKVDFALIGISGIETDGSLRDFDYREVKVAQAIIQQSREVWLAADHSKFNRQAMVAHGTLSQIHRLFTDQTPPEPFPALLAQANVGCVVG